MLIVLVHEIFGLNAQMRHVADDFTARGFTVLTIDLFAGRTTDDLTEALELGRGLDWAAAVGRVRDLVVTLGVTAPVALVGFCMGGSISLLAASECQGLWACVSFYGLPPGNHAPLTRITVPVLAHFALHDAYIPLSAVDALEELFAKARVPATIHRYDAGHGFVREDPSGSAARLAMSRTAAFLRRVERARR